MELIPEPCFWIGAVFHFSFSGSLQARNGYHFARFRVSKELRPRYLYVLTCLDFNSACKEVVVNLPISAYTSGLSPLL